MEVKFLSDIREIMMDKFIQCACHHNYQVLLMEGEATDQELIDAWIKVKSEHLKNINNTRANIDIEAAKEISDYELKKETVESLLDILIANYDERIIECLTDEGYDYAFTEDTYKDDIDRVRAELACEGMAINDHRIRIEESGSSLPEEQGYYEAIAALQKAFGLCAGLAPMRASKEISIYEYGMFFNQFNKMVKTNKTEVADAE
jgi:hypothetical protein